MKYRLAILAFASSVVAITMYGILWPSYDLGLFLDLETVFVRLRLAVVMVLVVYAFVPQVRTRVTQMGMLLAGVLFFAAGITAVFSPMLMGTLTHYTALGDVIIAIESGVIAMLAALELETKRLPRRTPVLMPSYYLYRLSKLKPQKQLSVASRTT